MSETNKFSYDCGEELAGQRLDQVLVRISGEISSPMSRSQIQRLIENKHVSVNDSTEDRPGYRVRSGDTVNFSIPEAESAEILPQEIPLNVIYQDKDIIALNKPAGLTVHPGAGQRDGTILNALAHHLRDDLPFTSATRPWIVHRIDKDTSGVLLIARNDRAHRELSRQFHDREVKKEYRALVLSTPRLRNPDFKGESGTIELPIDRHPTQRTRMAVNQRSGRAAVTHWKVVERFEYGTLLSVSIETGRTHQIRVHLEAVGAPIIGDRTYGNFQALPKHLNVLHEQFGRQALHAFQLACRHPGTGEQISFEAPVPDDMNALIDRWRQG